METGSYNKRLCKLGDVKLTIIQYLSSMIASVKRVVYPKRLSHGFSVELRGGMVLMAYNEDGDSKKKKKFFQISETGVSRRVGIFGLIGFWKWCGGL